MATIWLTYAWVDNENADVDYVIGALKEQGLDVRFDRVQLLAGRRLWEQIEAGMKDQSVGAWAMFVTEHSLASQPCMEEIAYALDRALSQSDRPFPLIGIFPRPIPREDVPSALATRLFVNLTENDWAAKVADGVRGASTRSSPEETVDFGFRLHTVGIETVLEVWPRSGRWLPFEAFTNTKGAIRQIFVGPSNSPILGGLVVGRQEINSDDNLWSGLRINQPVDRNSSAYLQIDPEFRGDIWVGDQNRGQRQITLRETVVFR